MNSIIIIIIIITHYSTTRTIIELSIREHCKVQYEQMNSNDMNRRWEERKEVTLFARAGDLLGGGRRRHVRYGGDSFPLVRRRRRRCGSWCGIWCGRRRALRLGGGHTTHLVVSSDLLRREIWIAVEVLDVTCALVLTLRFCSGFRFRSRQVDRNGNGKGNGNERKTLGGNGG